MMTTYSLVASVPGPGLLFGLVLVTAIVGGYAARIVRVPRVVGFLLGGVVLRLILSAAMKQPQSGSVTEDLAAAALPLGAITNLALGLILFAIGGVFERSRLRAGGVTMFKQSLAEVGCSLLLVFVLVTVALLITRGSSLMGEHLVLALLLAVSCIATAPAATLFVLQEYEAKEPVTERILGLTGLNNVVCVLAFFCVFLVLSSLGVIQASGLVAAHVGLSLLAATVGSVVLGIVTGAVISIIHGKLPLPETLLFFFAFFILLGAGESWLWKNYGVSYNFLLTSLVIGAVFSNVAIDAPRLEHTLKTVGAPVFAGFFVLAGYNLHLGDLAHMGWLGAAYVVARTAGKVVGCAIGARWAGDAPRNGERIGSAMLCQAAVVIGLCDFVHRASPGEFAREFSAVILGSVVVFEVIGPLLVKRCVVLAGEVKAITLMRRASVQSEGGSIVRITLQSLRRLVGLEPRNTNNDKGSMLVEHIMRTNIQFLHASTTFDEVLHFIERSTYSHFTVVHEDGTYAGVIHFSDVRDVIYDPALCELITAVDLADPDSPTIPADVTLNELFDVFTGSNLTVLPVVEKVEHSRIVGVVEQRDLLKALHRSPAQAPS